ncbi:general substrate transporter [Crucibulum laeve]|uniref:General substrate transporter n=1 Tax=Crucibulum laeve TaxID=68775 RepID=A0A5C3LYQ4_9AGAR|nr:general substrate transporter [Crucibulum laeve]
MSSHRKVPPSPTLHSHSEQVIVRRTTSSGIRGLVEERRIFGLALFCTIGGFLYGYNLGVFGGILVMSNFQRKFPSISSSSMQGLISSILNLGAWLGTIQNGWASERLGRRKSITFACVFFVLGVSLQTGAQSVGYLFVGRFLTGFGVGALSVASALYNSEISPSPIRGALGSLFQFSVETGTLLAFWIDYGTNNIGGSEEGQTEAAWRIPLALQLLPCFFLAIGILYAPESPRWLISKSRQADALKALVSLRHLPADSPEVQMEYLEILGQHKFEAELDEEEHGGIKGGLKDSVRMAWHQWSYLFKSAPNRKRVMVGVMVMLFQQWNGINAILFYAPTIFKGLGLSGTTTSLLATGVVGIVMLIATVPTVIYLDRVGRKPTLIVGAIIMGCCHLILAVLSGLYQDSWSSHKAILLTAGWVACVFVWIYSMAFATSFGPVAWVLCSEIFPLRARSKGLSIAASSSWVNSFIVGMATPTMLANLRFGTYIFFAVWCFLGAAFCLAIPETAGHSLEDMDVAFGDTNRTSMKDKERMARINAEIGFDRYMSQEKPTTVLRESVTTSDV